MGAERCNNCMAVGVGQGVCPRCGYDNRRQNGEHQLPAGTVLNGQYIVGRVLGQGGFGITYKGWDSFLETPVAIKEYFPTSFVTRTCAQSHEVRSYGGDAEARFEHNKRRFQREVRALARFTDVREIVQVKSFFYANNTAYIVMEYVDGVDIGGYMTKLGRALTMEETKRLLEPVVKAMVRVHKEGLVHRDLSPDNIMLLPDSSVKLLDFGAVRDLEPGGATTSSTEAIVKHGFAPIEQYVNSGDIGPWTDVYALCATMYYCVTGKIPPDAASRMMGKPLPRFRELGIAVSPADEEALRHGMELKLEDRLRDMGQLWDALYGGQAGRRARTSAQQTAASGSSGGASASSTGRTHTITFRDCRGKPIVQRPYRDGERIVPPSPGKAPDTGNLQYRFVGWSPAVPATAVGDGDYTAEFARVTAQSTAQPAISGFADFKRHGCAGLQGFRALTMYLLLLPTPLTFVCIFLINILYTLNESDSAISEAVDALAMVLSYGLSLGVILYIIFLLLRAFAYSKYKNSGTLKYGGPFRYGTVRLYAKQTDPERLKRRGLAAFIMYVVPGLFAFSVGMNINYAGDYSDMGIWISIWDKMIDFFFSEVGTLICLGVMAIATIIYISASTKMLRRFKSYIQGDSSVI